MRASRCGEADIRSHPSSPGPGETNRPWPASIHGRASAGHRDRPDVRRRAVPAGHGVRRAQPRRHLPQPGRWRDLGAAGSGLNLHDTIRSILVDVRQPEKVWTATSQGIYRSTNGGKSWARVLTSGGASLVQDPASALSTPAPIAVPCSVAPTTAPRGTRWPAHPKLCSTWRSTLSTPRPSMPITSGNCSRARTAARDGSGSPRGCRRTPSTPSRSIPVPGRSTSPPRARSRGRSSSAATTAARNGRRWTAARSPDSPPFWPST